MTDKGASAGALGMLVVSRPMARSPVFRRAGASKVEAKSHSPASTAPWRNEKKDKAKGKFEALDALLTLRATGMKSRSGEIPKRLRIPLANVATPSLKPSPMSSDGKPPTTPPTSEYLMAGETKNNDRDEETDEGASSMPLTRTRSPPRPSTSGVAVPSSGRLGRMNNAEDSNLAARPSTSAGVPASGAGVPLLEERVKIRPATSHTATTLKFASTASVSDPLKAVTLPSTGLAAISTSPDVVGGGVRDSHVGPPPASYALPTSLLFEAWSWKPLIVLDLSLWCNVVDDITLQQVVFYNRAFTQISLANSNSKGLRGPGFTTLVSQAYHLCVLDLSNCQWFNEKAALALATHAHGIEVLNLASTPIDDTVLRVLSKGLPRLVDLDMTRCVDISDRGMRVLVTRHKNLRHLRVGDCSSLTDLTLEVIATISLETLEIQNILGVTDEGLSLVLDRSEGILSHLDISGCSKITERSIRFFSERPVIYGVVTHKGFPTMTVLKMARNPNISDLSLSWVAAGAINLKLLDVTDCPSITHHGMKAVSMMRSLRELLLAGTMLNDEGLKLLCIGEEGVPSTVKNLTTLDLSRIQLMTDAGAECLGSKVKHVATLKLDGAEELRDDGLARILKKAKALTALSLADCKKLTPAVMIIITTKCRHMESLDLSGVSKMSDEAVAVLHELKHLKTLKLDSCKKLTDAALVHLPNWSLRNLSLAKLPLITDGGLAVFGGLCAELESLNVSKCAGLTVEGVLKVVAVKLTRLKDLNVYKVPGSHDAVSSVNKLLNDPTATQHKLHLEVSTSPHTLGFTLVRNGAGLAFQEAYKAQEELERHSAIVVQCCRRSCLARRHFKTLVDAKFIKDTKAAIIIQRVYRGHVGRAVASHLRRIMTTFAVRHQYLWRRFSYRKRLAKAIAFRASKVKVRSVRNWRKWTTESIRLRASLNANQKLEFAHKHFLKVLAIKVFLAWQSEAHSMALEKKALAKALKHWQSKAIKPMLAHWRFMAVEMLQRKRALVSIFIVCVDVSTYNSRRQKKPAFWATNKGENARRKRMLVLWKVYIEICRWQDRLARDNYLRLMSKPGHIVPQVWWAWRQHVATRRQKKRDLTKAIAYWFSSHKRDCIQRFHNRAVNRITYRENIRAAVNLWMNVSRAKGVRSWLAWAKKRIDMKQKMKKALSFLVSASKKRAFRAWQEWYAGILISRHKLAKAAALVRLVEGRKYILAWRTIVGSRHDAARRVLMRMHRNKLSVALDYWVKVNAYMRDVEDQERREYLRTYHAAVEIQRVYKGWKARKYAKDYRLKSTWAAMIVQRNYRGRLGKKRFARHIRYRDLREFKIIEYEFENMEREDRLSKIMEIAHKAAARMQGLYRGKQGRHVAYVARQAMVVERALKRQVDMEKQIAEHHRLVEERKKQKQKEMEMAVRIQALIRGRLGRKEAAVARHQRFLASKAVRLQAAFRRNRARRRTAAMRRNKAVEKEILRRAHVRGRFLRMLGFTSRAGQSWALNIVEALGIDPSTYGITKEEVMQDRDSFFRYLTYLKTLFKARRDAAKRDEIRQDYKKELDIKWIIEVGDAVRIIDPDHQLCGETGLILNIREGAVQGGQAHLLLDKDNTIIYMRLRTIPRKFQENSPTMMRIPDMKFNKYSSHFLRENAMALRVLAEELKQTDLLNWAAKLVQNKWRVARSKKLAESMKETNAKRVEKRKKLVEDFLTKTKCRNARMGRLLVSMKLVNESDLPGDLPDTPFFSTEVRVRFDLARRHVMRYREIQAVYRERYQFYKRFKRKDPNMVRWRRRTVIGRAWYAFYNKATELPRRLGMKLINVGSSRFRKASTPYELWHLLGWLVGGADLQRKAEEHKQWVGEYMFPQFQNDAHVTHSKYLHVGGYAVVHGHWLNGKPHGRCVARFLVGDKYAQGQLKDGIPVEEIDAWIAQQERKRAKRREAKGLTAVDGLASDTHVSPLSVDGIEIDVEAEAKEPSVTDKPLAKLAGEDEEAVDVEAELTRPLLGEESREPAQESKGDEGSKDVDKDLEETLVPDKVMASEDSKKDGDSKDADKEIVGAVAPVKAKPKIDLKASILTLLKARTDPTDTLVDPGPAEVPEAPLPLFQEIEGVFDHGKISGDVFIHFFGGAMYDGPWVPWGGHEGPLHWAMFTTQDKYTYEGQTVTPHFVPERATGRFKVTHPDGEEFDGYILNNMRHGHGICFYRNRSEFEGEWRHNMRHGYGILVLHNGERYEGYWEEDDMHGRGVMRLKDGSLYTGDFIENLYHGQGEMRYSSGDYYTGGWELSLMHGKGAKQYCAADGTLYIGDFSEGKRNGFGTLTYPNGESYIGPWLNGKQHGKGMWKQKVSQGWFEDREGLWTHGEHTSWLSLPINQAATQEFISRYPAMSSEEFAGAFSMILARKLPDLPNAVDGTNKTVMRIVAGVIAAAGPLSADIVIERTTLKLNEARPKLNAERARVVTLNEQLEDLEEEVADQEETADAVRDVYDAQLAKCDRLDREIKGFWDERKELQKEWRKAVGVLMNTKSLEFYKCTNRGEDPPIPHKKLATCLLLCWRKEYSWDLALNMLSTSKSNAEKGDKEAIANTYDVKLKHVLPRYDIYLLAAQPDMIAAMRQYYHDFDLREESLVMQDISTAAGAICTFFRFTYLYAIEAAKILPVIIKRRDAERKLLQDLDALDKEEQMFDDLEAQRDKCQEDLYISRGKRKDYEHEVEVLCNVLDVAMTFEDGNIVEGVWDKKDVTEKEAKLLELPPEAEDDLDSDVADDESENGTQHVREIERIKGLQGGLLAADDDPITPRQVKYVDPEPNKDLARIMMGLPPTDEPVHESRLTEAMVWDGWLEQKDAESGDWYFYNEISGDTSWDIPEQYLEPVVEEDPYAGVTPFAMSMSKYSAKVIATEFTAPPASAYYEGDGGYGEGYYEEDASYSSYDA